MNILKNLIDNKIYRAYKSYIKLQEKIEKMESGEIEWRWIKEINYIKGARTRSRRKFQNLLYTKDKTIKYDLNKEIKIREYLNKLIIKEIRNEVNKISKAGNFLNLIESERGIENEERNN